MLHSSASRRHNGVSLAVQSRISELETQVATLSSQCDDTDQERSSYISQITTLTDTLAFRNQQLMEARTQLAHVRDQVICCFLQAALACCNEADLFPTMHAPAQLTS